MNHNLLIEQQRKISERIMRQEYALKQKRKELNEQRDVIEKQFGTTDIEELRAIYRRLKEERETLVTSHAEIYNLANQALEMLENDQLVPADLVAALEHKVVLYNQQLKNSTEQNQAPTVAAQAKDSRDFAPTFQEREGQLQTYSRPVDEQQIQQGAPFVQMAAEAEQARQEQPSRQNSIPSLQQTPPQVTQNTNERFEGIDFSSFGNR